MEYTSRRCGLDQVLIWDQVENLGICVASIILDRLNRKFYFPSRIAFLHRMVLTIRDSPHIKIHYTS
jgi:hypothetical protein